MSKLLKEVTMATPKTGVSTKSFIEKLLEVTEDNGSEDKFDWYHPRQDPEEIIHLLKTGSWNEGGTAEKNLIQWETVEWMRKLYFSVKEHPIWCGVSSCCEPVVLSYTYENIPYLVLDVCGDCEYDVYHILYINDSGELAIYVPTSGNPYNRYLLSSFGGEDFGEAKEMEESVEEYCDRVGLRLDMEEDPDCEFELISRVCARNQGLYVPEGGDFVCQLNKHRSLENARREFEKKVSSILLPPRKV